MEMVGLASSHLRVRQRFDSSLDQVIPTRVFLHLQGKQNGGLVGNRPLVDGSFPLPSKVYQGFFLHRTCGDNGSGSVVLWLPFCCVVARTVSLFKRALKVEEENGSARKERSIANIKELAKDVEGPLESQGKLEVLPSLEELEGINFAMPLP